LARKPVKGCPQERYGIMLLIQRKRFVSRKVYLLSREKRKEVHEFISKQLRKEYIRPLKSPQTAPVFFVGKKHGKK